MLNLEYTSFQYIVVYIAVVQVCVFSQQMTFKV